VVRLGWWTFFRRALRRVVVDVGQAGRETRGGRRDAMEARSRMVEAFRVCAEYYSRDHQSPLYYFSRKLILTFGSHFSILLLPSHINSCWKGGSSGSSQIFPPLAYG
jgi:hypothetical protein